MRILVAIALGCWCLFAATGSSLAQPVMPGKPSAEAPSGTITSITLAQIVSVLQGAGFRASITTGSNGKKFVSSGMNGVNIVVAVYGCTDDNCTSLAFSAYWKKDPKITVAYANAWNIKYRFAKAYIDNDGDFNFDYDVELSGGVTLDHIKQCALRYEFLLTELGKFSAK